MIMFGAEHLFWLPALLVPLCLGLSATQSGTSRCPAEVQPHPHRRPEGLMD